MDRKVAGIQRNGKVRVVVKIITKFNETWWNTDILWMFTWSTAWVGFRHTFTESLHTFHDEPPFCGEVW